MTSSTGYYEFSSLPSTGTYTITPTKTHYTFSPTSTTYNTLTKNETSTDFDATLNQWAISGTITDGTNPVTNVTVSISTSNTYLSTSYTNSLGQYSFNNLDAGATYIITPTHVHYDFVPLNRTYIDLSNNINNANFTGNIHKWDISGNIVDENSNPLANVTVSLLKNGINDTSTVTNGSGNYIFNSLDAGSTYTITPSLVHYTFTPTDNTYGNLSNNIGNANFIGTRNRWSISGNIFENAEPLSNVTVILSGGKSDSQTTGITGYYEFKDLLAGATYIITPQKENYKFIDEYFTFADLSSNEMHNFSSEKIFTKDLNNLRVYPNPCIAKDIDHIIFDNLTENCTITIYNISGEKIFHGKNEEIVYNWYLQNSNDNNISSGVYFYLITNLKGEKKIGKIAIIK